MALWNRAVLVLMLVAACGGVAGAATIADLVEEVGPSVVYIEGDRGCGSGFVVRTDPVVEIVTNHHVIAGSDKLVVYFFPKPGPDGKAERVALPARPYFTFARIDYALVRLVEDAPAVKAFRPQIKALQLGDSQAARVGEAVFLIGSPGAGSLTLGNSVSDGIVSGKNRQINGIPYLQTTAPVNFGNSGGPLLNMEGDVIGIVTSKSIGTENISFALPIHMTDGKHYGFYLPEKLSDKAQARMLAGDELYDAKKFEEAAVEFRKAQELEPDKVLPIMAEAHARYNMGEEDEAAELFERAIAAKNVKYDDLMECVTQLGILYGRQGKTQKALHVFQAGLERDPMHVRLNRNIGVAYANTGQKSKALAHWYLSLSADPDQPQLKRNFLKLMEP